MLRSRRMQLTAEWAEKFLTRRDSIESLLFFSSSNVAAAAARQAECVVEAW